MSSQEWLQALTQRVDQLSDTQLEDLKTFFIQTHAARHQQQTQVASESILEGMEQIFSQLDAGTVQMLKDKIRG